MNSVSIASATVGVSATALKITKALNDFRSKYRQPSMTVSAICSESAIINASLSQVQSLIFREGDAFVRKLEERQGLCTTFDIALTGCELLFSSLEEEISDLRAALSADGPWTGNTDRKPLAMKRP
ncbi:hypothetical protein BT63DRAFT_308791 [Microthyrium microscopicum]|uniref:Fungal N-terminal domain-containing protein n=1 Tax=Microthyrium microscopicum TaxID=703497 RepID=A0A6A6U8Z4_9PEZI|nr:hypothetical protein BT63DRAFT_308791 [Microthyrium microscopicum]